MSEEKQRGLENKVSQLDTENKSSYTILVMEGLVNYEEIMVDNKM